MSFNPEPLAPWQLPLTPEQSVTVLQLTDLHLTEPPGRPVHGYNTEQSFRSVLEHLRADPRWPPDLILLTGDLAEDYVPATYRRLTAALNELAVPCACLPGNHDDIPTMRAELLSPTVGMPPVIHAGRWGIFCLNSQVTGAIGGAVTPADLKWLSNALPSVAHALVVLHHPPLPVNSAWIDAIGLTNGAAVVAQLASVPTLRAVLAGHVHQYSEAAYGALRVLTTPSTCYQFKPFSSSFALDDASPGGRWLYLHPDGTLETSIKRLPEAA